MSEQLYFNLLMVNGDKSSSAFPIMVIDLLFMTRAEGFSAKHEKER